MQTGKVRYLRRDSVHCPEGAPCPNNDNMVLIEAYGSAGYYTGYHHVKPIPELQEGMEVEAGQMIGHIDSSGRTSTPHLHLARYTPGDSATWWQQDRGDCHWAIHGVDNFVIMPDCCPECYIGGH
ncbi:M23 family metallopeptidase [Neobacillus drentensis]|uniref:M23 family metallopeptidase n=1 Tax=Neobacillus drentensis TaxID=220684 RepID=UPI0030023899